MGLSASTIRQIVPALSLAVLLAAVFYIQPRAMSYVGLNLLFNLAVPIALATVAQMMIMPISRRPMASIPPRMAISPLR